MSKPRKKYFPGKHLRNRTIVRPTLMEVRRCFEPIDLIFASLEQGEATEIEGELAFYDEEDGAWYQLVPAMQGWCALWVRLVEKFSLQIDLAPVTQLVERLAADELLTPGQVAAAKAVIDQCRRAYMALDVHEVKSCVRAQQIKIQLEEAGELKAA